MNCASVQGMHEHLSAPLRELLAIYAEKYVEVRFPGLDLAVLEGAADQVGQAVAKVIEAEAAVERLREEVRAAEGELNQKAARALSFLKVYVEGDEAEYARLDGLTQALLARPRARRAAESTNGANREKTRGRKGKLNSSAPNEPLDDPPNLEELAEVDLPSSALSSLDRVAE